MEIEKIDSNLKPVSLNEELIARFIGFYLMNIDIPEDLYQYVKENKDKINLPNMEMFFSVIFGAPDEKNDMVRKMAIDFIK